MSSFVITEAGLPIQIVPAETAQLIINLNVVDLTVSNYQEIIPYLSIDGTQVAIKRCAWSKARGDVGIGCEFTFANPSHRNLLQPDATLYFKVGLKKNGVIAWKIIADLQRLSQRSYTVDGDEVIFSSVSGVVEKLKINPTVPFMLYDPNRITFDAALQDRLYDTEGNIYSVEEVQTAALSLHSILQLVFVDKCGFDSYWTDIEDHLVPQFAVDVTETFLDALNPLLEPFCAEGQDGPLLVERDGQLRIYDTSRPVPPNFPAPTDLSRWGCSSLRVDRDYSDVVAAKMVFSTSATAFDYVTSRIAWSNLPTDGGLWVLTIRNIYELRSFFQPLIVMDEREQFFFELTSTILGQQHNMEVVSNVYDNLARLATTQSQRWYTVPSYLGLAPTFAGRQPDENELQIFTYAQHPRRVGRQYQSGSSKLVEGLVLVDADNPYLNAPFKQALRHAHWTGNQGTAVERGDIRTSRETVIPHSNGQVTRRKVDYDHQRGLGLHPARDTQAADPTLAGGSGDSSRSREIIVTEDGSPYTTGRVISINVGQVPFTISVPLVRRKLRKMQNAPCEASLGVIGFNPAIDVGLDFSVSDKDGQIEGNFKCVGYAGVGENLGMPDESWSMTVDGIEI